MDVRELIGPALLGLVIALVAFTIFSTRQKIVAYMRETRAELGKVSWPSRAEAANLTVVVLVTITVSALFLGFFDAVFTWVFAQVMQ
ncbi:MAG TPA: preprotein translocase subunit SecE [Anaerolineales bacterium]|jgi:preprotein translocase subunit SecE|nr:preprotein translocase subunit SecE [Anaerolineales bacterium]HJL70269.1 preprotein translocase subunit SecE [Anaerolineales bacterium]|tara:strand:- start:3199 stop:3459 length:261 start_codon:yes stop_codon:yes gene_type:complete